MNEVTLGDKIYISSKRAAEITGYAKDYVGQLCREGHVDAKMIGRGWYVYEPSIRAHRFGAESVVVAPQEEVEEATSEAPEADVSSSEGWQKPIYTSESHEMLPEIPESSVPAYEPVPVVAEETLTDMQSAWKEWFDRKQSVLATPEIESPEVIDARNDEYVAQHEDLSTESAEEAPTYEDEVVENAEDDEEVQIPLHHIEDDNENEEESVYTEAEAPAEPIRIRPIESRAEPVVVAPVPAYPSYYAAPEARYVTTAPADAEPEAQIISERVISKQESARRKSGKGAGRAYRSTKGSSSNAPMIALLIGISIVTIAITVIGSGIADHYVQTFSAHNPIVDFLTGTREISK